METIVAFIYSAAYFIFGFLVGYSICVILDYLQKLIRRFMEKNKNN